MHHRSRVAYTSDTFRKLSSLMIFTRLYIFETRLQRDQKKTCVANCQTLKSLSKKLKRKSVIIEMPSNGPFLIKVMIKVMLNASRSAGAAKEDVFL